MAFAVHDIWIWSVVYWLSADRASLFLILAEAASGIMFFKGQQPPLEFNKVRGALLNEYQGEMDWVKIGEPTAEWAAFVHQWKALADRLC